MKSKIGAVVMANARGDALGPVVGTQNGKPCGAVLVVGVLDGREVMIGMSSQEAIGLAAGILAAAAAADGFTPPTTEVAPSSAEVPRGRA